MARKANALSQIGKLDESIALYQSALLENNDGNIKDQLKKIEKQKKIQEEQQYINPEIAEEHRVKGNSLYEEGNFPAAVKEYTEGLRRDP